MALGMAMKQYIAAVAESATVSVYTVAPGKEAVVVDLTITAGTAGGAINIVTEDASENTHTLPLTLGASETVIMDNKKLLDAGCNISVTSVTGTFQVSASVMEYTIA